MWKKAKWITILLWALAAISVLVCLYIFVRSGRLNMSSPEDKERMLSALNVPGLWALILVVVTTLLAIFLPVPQLIDSPKSALGIGIGIGALVVVVLIAFLLSKSDPLPFTPGHAAVSEGTVKFADVNLISVYIMLGLTILATLGASILGILKTR
jgi:hypothetical protein